jgi:hypothetical protein
MGLRCVLCGATSDDATIAVEVLTGNVHCGSCEESATPAQIRSAVEGWLAVLPWIESHPTHHAAPERPATLPVAHAA